MLDSSEPPQLDPEVADAVRPGRPRRLRGLVIGAIAVALVGAGVYGGMRDRADAEATLKARTLANAVPTVSVVHPVSEAPDQTLSLPGQTTAFIEAPIYARTSGYLRQWTYDIGAHVHAGDVLARIETPELDQQLRQAKEQLVQLQAAVGQAEANAELGRVTDARTSRLVAQGWTSQQQGDQDRLGFAASRAALAVAKANVAAQQAEVKRLQQLVDFEQVTAPFDGVITARNTDIGALINAGAGAPGAELFHIAAIKTLRIYVAVPEIDSPAMHVGAAAGVTVEEFPGETFHGTLVRTDNAINPTTRTLLVEVDVDNSAGKLLPGAYAFVHFTLPGRARSVVIPVNTLLFRAEGLRVGVVRNGVVELVPIKIGRDYGDRVEVLSGLAPTDDVILNPPDSLLGGTAVQVTPEKPPGVG